jgi:hypothetical protein
VDRLHELVYRFGVQNLLAAGRERLGPSRTLPDGRSKESCVERCAAAHETRGGILRTLGDHRTATRELEFWIH